MRTKYTNGKTALLTTFAAVLTLAMSTGAIGGVSEYFTVAGHQAFVLKPDNATADTPWVWYAPTLVGHVPNDSNDWIFDRLLANNIAVAGIDVGESYGSPDGRALFSNFYDYATTTAGLGDKPILLAQSRGGLMLYNWAAENASKVRAIAGIYPVCDLRSYPGLETAAPAYGMTAAELEASLLENNPIDRLAPLAEADIPIFHMHGDSDTVVPLSENSQVVYDRYTAMGGQMELLVVPGKGHEEVPEFFESQQLLNFLIDPPASNVPEPSVLALLAGAAGCLGLYAWWNRKRKQK